MNIKTLIIIAKDIIIKDIMFKILINCFKKFQDVIAMHKIDITNDTDSNVIIKAPINLNDIEFKQLSFFFIILNFVHLNYYNKI